jgi:hypothetical protein
MKTKRETCAAIPKTLLVKYTLLFHCLILLFSFIPDYIPYLPPPPGFTLFFLSYEHLSEKKCFSYELNFLYINDNRLLTQWVFKLYFSHHNDIFFCIFVFCIFAINVALWTRHLRFFPVVFAKQLVRVDSYGPVPVCRDPVSGMKTSVFVKTSQKRSFSFQTVLRDLIFSLYWRDKFWRSFSNIGLRRSKEEPPYFLALFFSKNRSSQDWYVV